MNVNVKNAVMRQLMSLAGMSVVQLKERWRELYGCEPPELKHSFLVKRLSYRIQELYYGGLDSETLSRINTGSAEQQAKSTRKLTAGTRISRIYKGAKYEVLVCDKGFEYRGKKYRSLSGVAKDITGSHVNGKTFFGVN